jgi:putative DNA primase/helicase
MIDAISKFSDAIRAAGLEPPIKIQPGVLHRFPGKGKGKGNKAGWCVLFKDLRGGVFGDHFSGINEHWQADGWEKLSPKEQEAFHQRCKAEYETRAKEQQQRYTASAAKAIEILNSATGGVNTHTYAVLKKVPLGQNIKRGAWSQRSWNDALLIPLYDTSGKICTLQAINIDGKKDFLSGGRQKGCFYPFGEIKGAEKVLIGEGIATVAAVYAVTGTPAVAAMSAHNLCDVALAVRELAPTAKIILLADNDLSEDGKNVGVKAATEAAEAVAGIIVIPELNNQECDFWNLWNEKGKNAILEALKTASWPEPLKIGPTIKKSHESYPVEALPETIRLAVEEVAAYSQAPIALVASSALAAVSLAVQAYSDVKRGNRLTGPSSLYFLILAASGERKSSVASGFFAPITAFEEEQRQKNKPLQDKYEAELSAWEAKCNGVKEKIRNLSKKESDTFQQEERLQQLQQQKPITPKIPKLVYADFTPEALAASLASRWPSGGIISSEAGTVLGSHGMSADSIMRNLSLLNQLWDGGIIDIVRKSSMPYTLNGVRLTSFMQVQPETFQRFLQQSGNLARGIGFLARCLFAFPESTQGTRFYKELPDNAPHLEAFNKKIMIILNTTVPLNESGNLSPAVVAFSDDAKKVWVEHHDAIESMLGNGGELSSIADVASKSSDNAARLSCLFQAFEYGVGTSICVDSMKRASKIAAWYINESLRFLGKNTLSTDQENMQQLSTWLIKACLENKTDAVEKSKIIKYGPSFVRKAKELDHYINLLEKHLHIRLTKKERISFVQINPALLRGKP